MVADLCHVVLSCFRGEMAPRENPPIDGVFSHGDLSPRHTKVRHFSCIAFSPPVCHIFAWRGERSPREKTPKSPGKDTTNRGENAKGRHAKIRQLMACFRMATFRPATRTYDTFHASPFCDIPCVAFSATVCRIFAWRGERSTCENRQNHIVAGFGNLSRYRPENTFIRHGINQLP